MIVHHGPAVPGPATRAGRRRGTSLIETQIAFVILAIGLGGLCPIVAMNYRQLSHLEGNIHEPDGQHTVHYLSPTTANGQRGRLQAFSFTYHSPGAQQAQASPGQVHYLVPWNNPWGRKLTTRAQVVPGPWTSTGSLDPAVAMPSDPLVTLRSLERMEDVNGNFTGWRASVDLK